MAVDAFFLVPRPGIEHVPVGQHRAPLVGDIKKISVAFEALFIFKRCICSFAVFRVVVLIRNKVHKNVFDAVQRFGIEEVGGVLGGGQMTIHAIGDESVGVVGMGGGAPSLHGELDLVAGAAKTRCGCPHHRVVSDAEEREGEYDPDGDQNGCLEVLFH